MNEKKRAREQSFELYKRQFLNNNSKNLRDLPQDLWWEIAKKLDYRSFGRLVRTKASFFTPIYSFDKLIKIKFFDFNSSNELFHKLEKFGCIAPNWRYITLQQQFENQGKEVQKLCDKKIPPINKMSFLIREGNITGLRSQPCLRECINLCDDSGMNLLGYAAIHQRKTIFFNLMEAGAKINLKSEPADDLICTNNTVTCELSPGCVITTTPLHIIAALHGDDEWLQELFSTFKDLPTEFSYKNDCPKEYYEALRAILMNDSQSLQNLLDENDTLLTELDSANWSLLHWVCCFKKSVVCLELLISKGANLNEDLSPAFLAASSGNEPALKVLSRFQEDFAGDISGNSPLHVAAYNGRAECTRLLLELGQDAHQMNSFDNTPFLLVAGEENKLSALNLEDEVIRFCCLRISEQIINNRVKCREIILTHQNTLLGNRN